MSTLRIRRIQKEIQQFKQDPPDHIFINIDETNLTHIEVLFIGPRQTPYSRMFLRFTIDYPPEYPIKPPNVVFSSNYARKIHPNIFPGGWICLSTLNTGEADGWVPSINLSALLNTLYSMFNEEMIATDNTHTHERSKDFFPAVMYDTFYITTHLLVDEQNVALKNIMQEYLEKHREWYIRKLQKLATQYDGKVLPNYYQECKAEFGKLICVFGN